MTFATKNLTHGQINALVKNLMSQMGTFDPVEAIRRINAGEWILTQVKLHTFTTWKEVTIGELGDTKAAREQLESSGIEISCHADDILEQMNFKPTRDILDLVDASVSDLGLKNGSTTAEIYAAAERHGLFTCPAEVALQLLIKYPNLLPMGTSREIAMEPLVDSEGYHLRFRLEYYKNARSLKVSNPNYGNHSNERFIFVRSK